jgi:hypothetical protein
MQQTQQTTPTVLFARQQEAQIRDALPLFVPRDKTTEIPENRSQLYRVRWNCPCCGRVKSDARVPSKGATHQEMIQKLVAVVNQQHGICAKQYAAYPAPPEEEAAAKIGGSSFFSRLKSAFISWVWALTWSFGCPGHGKGVWDGLGGLVKRMLRQCIVQHTELSDSSVIKNWVDVHQHLRVASTRGIYAWHLR